MKKQLFWIAIVMLTALISLFNVYAAESQDNSSIAAGRYLVTIAGCNDCHTKGWIATEAKVPESEWLGGDITGWSGPWGTTYPPNLKLLMQSLSEDAWVNFAHTLKTRPPMPWWALHEMTEADLRSIYRFTKSLGPIRTQAPQYLPPGQKPKPPYFLFVPPQ